MGGATGARDVLTPPFTVLVLALILIGGRFLAGVLLGGVVFLVGDAFLGNGLGVTFLGGVGVGTGATFFGGRGAGGSGTRFR